MIKYITITFYLFLFFGIVFSQTYGDLTGTIVKNGDESSALKLSDLKATVFIENLSIISHEPQIGRLNFIWKSRKLPADVTDTTFVLPMESDEDFSVEWGPDPGYYDEVGNYIDKYKITGGNVRTEKKDNAIRFYFNISAEDRGNKYEFKDGKFEYFMNK